MKSLYILIVVLCLSIVIFNSQCSNTYMEDNKKAIIETHEFKNYYQLDWKNSIAIDSLDQLWHLSHLDETGKITHRELIATPKVWIVKQ
jgi:hypothetical protein